MKDEPKKDFKAFLKKRAPIYLGLIGLFLIFVVPELTKGDLESSLPQLAEDDQKIVDILMKYNGPNGTGLTVMDAISDKIVQEYPNEKIYNNKKTTIDITVSELDSQTHTVSFDFKSHKGEINYSWNVNIDSKDIHANNPESKHIIDVVNFYD